MNNLKFRVWCPGGKRFYYNPYIYNGEAYCWNNTETELVKWYSKEQELVHGKVIIEQFTGLKDKNGKEIYNGDIVKIGELINEIVFIDGAFCLKNIPDDNGGWMNDNLSVWNNMGKIVGNIHENPELLTKCKNV